MRVHIFHDWSKWSTVDQDDTMREMTKAALAAFAANPTEMTISPYWAERRVCETCGRSEVRKLQA